MPPRAMFYGRRRPNGLVFACCDACNQGTKHADLVASLIGRSYPDPPSAAERAEAEDLFRAVRNNVPGLLREMKLGRAGEKLAAKKTPVPEGGGLLRVGTLLHAYMQTFSWKAGLALHYEATKRILPPEGGVCARWFSNAERARDEFPDSVFEHLLPASTLRQGKVSVSDQFEYSWRLTDDGTMGMFLATFRFSFAVLAFTATRRERLSAGPERNLISPGELRVPHYPRGFGESGPVAVGFKVIP